MFLVVILHSCQAYMVVSEARWRGWPTKASKILKTGLQTWKPRIKNLVQLSSVINWFQYCWMLNNLAIVKQVHNGFRLSLTPRACVIICRQTLTAFVNKDPYEQAFKELHESKLDLFNVKHLKWDLTFYNKIKSRYGLLSHEITNVSRFASLHNPFSLIIFYNLLNEIK